MHSSTTGTEARSSVPQPADNDRVHTLHSLAGTVGKVRAIAEMHSDGSMTAERAMARIAEIVGEDLTA